MTTWKKVYNLKTRQSGTVQKMHIHVVEASSSMTNELKYETLYAEGILSY